MQEKLISGFQAKLVLDRWMDAQTDKHECIGPFQLNLGVQKINSLHLTLVILFEKMARSVLEEKSSFEMLFG